MGKQQLFITGVTGFIGGRLVKKLLIEQPNTIFWLLIRSNRTPAKERFTKLLKQFSEQTQILLTELKERLYLVEGDIELPQFGLAKQAFKELAFSIDTIYHIAASVKLSCRLEDARRTNAGGTKTILELAYLAHEYGQFHRLNYTSTAYVGGQRTGLIKENELNLGQSFCNEYEQAKMEAESFVEAAKADLPITIFRPSIVMGDSKTGWTSAFNVLYGPFKLMYYGRLDYAPGSRYTKLDVVPIDFVVNGMAYLAQLNEEVVGKTFHLTVGEGRYTSIKPLLEDAYAYLDKYNRLYNCQSRLKKAKMLHPYLIIIWGKILHFFSKGRKRKIIQELLTYTKYTYKIKEFDNSEAMKLLAPAGIVPPKLEDYLEVLCEYAVKTQFGKKKALPKPVLV